jgi:hypothetical protein
MTETGSPINYLLEFQILYQDFEVFCMKKYQNYHWKAWKKLSELTEQEKQEVNLRRVFDDELIIDLEDPNDLEKAELKLQEDGMRYHVWSTGSRGYHINLYFGQLRDFSAEERTVVKKKLIERYFGDSTKKDQKNLIALEGAAHFKTGNKKTLFKAEDDCRRNNLPPFAINSYLLQSIVKKLNDPLIEYCTKNVIPSGSRDMILFKNLAVQFVKEKLSVGAIETLVTAIIANCPNKKESEFYGWIDKAKKGQITEYNKQEMNRWIKKQKINVAVLRKSEEKPLYSDEDFKEAERIAKEELPLSFLVETISKIHSREKDSILLLLLSGISSGNANRKLILHTMAVGSSGKGKTAVMDAVSKVFTKVQRITSSSAKSQFYKSKIGQMIDKGILIFDEAENSKEAQALERAYTDPVGENPSHETVDKDGNFNRIEIKEKNAVWRNSVNTPEDNEGQLCNRYIMFNVDESSLQDHIVFQHQINKLAFGGDEKLEDKSFKVAKALTDLIKKESIKVFIPYAHLLNPSKKSNRRSFGKFLSFIWAVTYFSRFQRKQIGDYYIATFDDFTVAKLVWDKVNRMEHLHIREKDQLILAILNHTDWMGVDEIVQNPDIKISRSSVVRALKDMRDKGYADCRKVEGYSNKYEWQAYHNISQLTINFPKDEFTLEVLKQTINTLLSNINDSTCQLTKETESNKLIELYRQVTGLTPVFDKLKSLIETDQEQSHNYDKEIEQGQEVQQEPEELIVEEEHILNEDEAKLYDYLRSKIDYDEEKTRDEFGDELVDRLLRMRQIKKTSEGKLMAR